jgi:hypothetical protein
MFSEGTSGKSSREYRITMACSGSRRIPGNRADVLQPPDPMTGYLLAAWADLKLRKTRPAGIKIRKFPSDAKKIKQRSHKNFQNFLP